MGYPGQVDVSVTYSLNDGELHFRYAAVTDKATLVSMTNHAYWNLKGHQAGNVLDHTLMVAASRTTATDETLAITGELPEVAGGFDLRHPRLLQQAVEEAGPIDRNYCLDRPSGTPGREILAARLVGPNKVTMEIWTDQPGLQVFTGSNIAATGPGTWWHGKGCEWQQFGAICLEPQLWPDAVCSSVRCKFAGLYDDFVMLLDFNSLYPSIIQEHNICFTTVDRPDENEVAKLATEAQLLAKTHADGMADEGILPQVLRRLVDSRRQVKAAMKAEKNPKLLQVLEIRQKALKLTANSMYGCLGFQHSRFHARPLAALITAMGREALQSTISVVNQELQLDVVYGDTDSVFVNTKTSNFQQAMQIGEQIKRSVNKRYKKLEIEIDGVFVRLMLLKKKKYAAMKVLNWEEQIFEKEFKGLDIVRRDWCGLAKEMGEAILMRILDTKSNQEESLHWVHQYLADKSKEMDDGKVSLDKFIITKGLTKDPKDYPDAKTQPHVQVALRLISRGKHVRPGQEIGYVICNPTGDGTAKDLLAERARHPHDVQTDQSLSLDIAWYKKQQVHPLVSRILAVVEGTSSARLAECLGEGSLLPCDVLGGLLGELVFATLREEPCRKS
ncbi:DNA polymerase alpha catalytic subunit [Durusdinium trenchii]|uniref:DNA polymerase n=1 Tax=Durusdinium trenchii TaxID=1381693 RepID=A0ABP0MB91_9DINO